MSLSVLHTFSSAFEADMAVEMLKANGIRAVARTNDIVGIFGPGFSGPTAQGVSVLVPPSSVEEARTLLDL